MSGIPIEFALPCMTGCGAGVSVRVCRGSTCDATEPATSTSLSVYSATFSDDTMSAVELMESADGQLAIRFTIGPGHPVAEPDGGTTAPPLCVRVDRGPTVLYQRCGPVAWKERRTCSSLCQTGSWAPDP